MPTVIVIVMFYSATVCATFRLKGHSHFYQDCSETLQHVLNHVIGPYAKHRLPDFGR